MFFSFSISLFKFLFQLYSLSLRVLVVYFHPSDPEEFLYQDDCSDIAHDISAEASVSQEYFCDGNPTLIGSIKDLAFE